MRLTLRTNVPSLQFCLTLAIIHQPQGVKHYDLLKHYVTARIGNRSAGALEMGYNKKLGVGYVHEFAYLTDLWIHSPLTVCSLRILIWGSGQQTLQKRARTGAMLIVMMTRLCQ